MRIISIRQYWGRNIFSHKPVVQIIIDLEDLAETATKDLTGFNDRLLNMFPGLSSHYCSPGYEGGFIQRLKEGTLVSHVIEHVALELQCMVGYDVYFGKTRVVEEPSIYYIVYEYMNEYCAKDFGYAAAEIVKSLAVNTEISIERILNRLNNMAFDSNLGPSTQAIMDEAKKRCIPVRRVDQDSLLQLGYGKYMRVLEASLLDATGCISVDLAKNKQLVKDLLREQCIPVPEGGIVNSEEDAVILAEEIGYPIVVKPLDGNQGKGVTTNIWDEDSLRKAYQTASSYKKRIIVEKCIKGKDYRVLVVGNRVVAAAERKPPYIIGDGIHSISELVAEENNNENRGVGHEKSLTRIYLDSVARDFLSRSGYGIDSVPKAGAKVYLRENGNLSTGGSARDCTLDIHPSNRGLAVKAAKVIGLDIAGIDLVIEDISQALTPGNGAIIEVNAAPGLRMHLNPSEGIGRNVARDIFDYMYPEGTPASIPIISITGTNGKTTVTRLIRHVLSLTGKKVGMTSTSGTYIGEECISKGDNTGPLSAQSVLYNRDIDIAVLETARGGIIRKGLGYDLADIGVIVNISDDHLGQDGIDTLQDLAFVKSLVVEAVKPTGYAILNADDHMTEQILSRVTCNLIFFSRYRNNILVDHHINQGGMAVVVENDSICFYQGRRKISVMGVHEIPITFGGKAIVNVENSLAAMASLFASNVAIKTIRSGLMSFKPDPFINGGRFNLFDLGDFQVLLDYGHNLSGYRSVLQFINSLDASRLVGVIGMPGDRRDEAIFQVGQLAGNQFAKLYVKEDRDLRGRAPGETANILYHGAITAGAESENIEIILSETDALEAAIKNAFPGDLIVIFYEDYDKALGLIQKFRTSHEEPVFYTPYPIFPMKPVESV